MYGFLTKKNNGSYGLPLVDVFRRPKQFVVEEVVYGPGVWTKWSNAQLAKVGATKISDTTSVPDGKEKAGTYTDTYSGNIVERVYDLQDKPLAPRISSMLVFVNSKRDSIISAGIDVTIRGSSYVLETGPDSRDSVSGTVAAIAAGVPLPDGFSWRMRDNTDVALDAIEMVTLGAAVLAHVNAAHAASRVHKEAIPAIATWDEASAYDMEAGWPAVADPVV